MSGILTIHEDSNGVAGINISGVMRIDNRPQSDKGTNYNMCLENPNADYLVASKESDSIIPLTGNPPTDEMNVLYTLVEEHEQISAVISSLPRSIASHIYTENSRIMIEPEHRVGSIVGVAMNAAIGCTLLNFDALPKTIRTIGDSSFSGCSSLTIHSLPDSLRSIGMDAFKKCSSIEVLDIRECDLLEFIGGEAFNDINGTVIMTSNQVEKFKTRLTQIPSGYQLDSMIVQIKEKGE